jgi:hypothetical protein
MYQCNAGRRDAKGNQGAQLKLKFAKYEPKQSIGQVIGYELVSYLALVFCFRRKTPMCLNHGHVPGQRTRVGTYCRECSRLINDPSQLRKDLPVENAGNGH